jgi:hypothetical protein
MPPTEVLFYREDDESVPVLDWLHALRERDERAFRRCFGAIQQLKQSGHELRRPHADMLRDGVYELRTRVGNVNYRILYGIVGKDVALLAAGFTKEKKIPSKEIERAITRIKNYKANPEVHGFSHDEENKNG